MKQKLIQYRLHYPYKALLICLSLAFMQELSAKEYTREYTGKTNVAPTDVLLITLHQIDDAVIKTSDSPTASFKIKVALDLSEDNDSKAKELLDAFDFSIRKTGNKVHLDLSPFQTFSSTNKGLGKTTMKLKNGGGSFTFKGKNKLNIYVEATIPKKNALEFDSNFSTATLGHLSNTADIDLSHSTLKTNDIGKLNLDANFSNINLGNVSNNSEIDLIHSNMTGLDIGNISAELSFSNVEFADCGNLDLHDLSQSNFSANAVKNISVDDSRFSTIDINKAKNITVDNDGQGKLFVDEAENLEFGDTNFSKITIQNCKDVRFEEMSQTTFKANTTEDIDVSDANFSTIDVENANTINVGDDSQGKYLINNLDEYELNDGSFTKIEIQKLNSKFKTSATHTDVKIEQLGQDFSDFNLRDSFASVSLGTNELTDFSLYLDDSEFTTVKNASGIEKKAKGFYQKHTTSKTPLNMNIDCSNCTVNLK